MPKKLRPRPAFAFVEANESLPNVLLIGDSVSMSYTAEVRECLENIANVYRVPRNARSTAYTIARLDQFLGRNAWDVIVFNWGLHDLTRVDDSGKPARAPEGKHQVSLPEYRGYLEFLARRLAESGNHIIWATTTPVGAKTENRGFRSNRDVRDYNLIAAEYMDANKIGIVDLYDIVAREDDWHQTDGLHFDETGQRILADAVVESILSVLREPAKQQLNCF